MTLYESELKLLKEELRDLKNCQVQFVTFPVSVTAILFGIANRLPSDDPSSFSGISYLAPLVIILPAWWIFFEKAKTISRIVGYYRVLEKFSLGVYKINFIGWENSQAKYRKAEKAEKLVVQAGGVKSHPRYRWYIPLQMSSPYWDCVFLIYFFLSLLSICLFLWWYLHVAQIINIFPYFLLLFAIFLVSYYRNVNILRKLIFGEFSYDHNEQLWIQLLEARESSVVDYIY